MSLMQFMLGHSAQALGLVVRWCSERRAATAIEYGLIAGAIALAIVAAVFLMGGSLSELFSTIAGVMADASERVASS